MEDINISIDNALRQASMTASEYLNSSLKILEEATGIRTLERMNTAVELAKVCAMDFHTAVIGSKLQDIRDSIDKLAEKQSQE